jgi:hypothetical protein
MRADDERCSMKEPFAQNETVDTPTTLQIRPGVWKRIAECTETDLNAAATLAESRARAWLKPAPPMFKKPLTELIKAQHVEDDE